MTRAHRQPSLRGLLAELYIGADIHGVSLEKRLGRGAVVKARSRLIVADDGGRRRRRQLIIGRQGAPVGLDEDATFRRDGQIPLDAEGVCYLPTAEGWHYVTYTWETAAIELPIADLPESL